MHSTILITISTEHAKDSIEARSYVFETLMDDPTFLDEGGKAVCDRFVIGGRSSGLLTELDERQHERPSPASPWVLRSPSAPGAPDVFKDLGAEDDAMLVDERLYGRLLAQFEGLNGVWLGPNKDLVYFDLDNEPVSPEFIGTKWLVVVDCYS
jgi:hypothetical protein